MPGIIALNEMTKYMILQRQGDTTKKTKQENSPLPNMVF